MKTPIQKLSFPVRAARYFKDGNVPIMRKLVALFAVLYVAMPLDAVPDVIPLVGWLDDVGVMGAIGWFFMREINAHKRVVDGEAVDAIPRDEENRKRF